MTKSGCAISNAAVLCSVRVAEKESGGCWGYDWRCRVVLLLAHLWILHGLLNGSALFLLVGVGSLSPQPERGVSSAVSSPCARVQRPSDADLAHPADHAWTLVRRLIHVACVAE